MSEKLPPLGSELMSFLQAQRYAKICANEFNCPIIVYKNTLHDNDDYDVCILGSIPSFGLLVSDPFYPDKIKE
jgi:hypothetical protein